MWAIAHCTARFGQCIRRGRRGVHDERRGQRRQLVTAAGRAPGGGATAIEPPGWAPPPPSPPPLPRLPSPLSLTRRCVCGITGAGQPPTRGGAHGCEYARRAARRTAARGGVQTHSSKGNTLRTLSTDDGRGWGASPGRRTHLLRDPATPATPADAGQPPPGVPAAAGVSTHPQRRARAISVQRWRGLDVANAPGPHGQEKGG